MDVHTAIARAVGIIGVRHQRVTLAMEAQRDLFFRNTLGLQVVHHCKGTAPGQVTVGQAVAAVIRVAIELDMIDRRIGFQVSHDSLQTHFGLGIKIDTAAWKADFALLDLIVIHRQQLADALLIIPKRLVEPDRQQAHLIGAPRVARVVTDNRAAPFHQAADQPPGLDLRTAERKFAIAHAHRAQIDVATPGLPRCGSGQQGRRTASEGIGRRLDAERRLLARAPHKLTRTEIGDGLAETALELIAFHSPFDAFQTCLESGRHRRQGREHAEQG